jgi:predicted acyltransferase
MRSVKLILVGLLINVMLVAPPFINNFNDFRIPGVLQRIGIVYLFSAIFYLKFNWKILLVVCVSILFLYWILLAYIPIATNTSPSFERVQQNWVLLVDQKILGSHMWKEDYDPEGILSTLTAISSCLIGVFAAKILEIKKQMLFYMGSILLVLGNFFSESFPLNKSLWTSSFVLVTSGWCFLLLYCAEYLISNREFKFLSIFSYTGMNAIVIYVFSSIITILFYSIHLDNQSLHHWLFNELLSYSSIGFKGTSLLYAIIATSFYLGLAYYMYKRGLFIKI